MSAKDYAMPAALIVLILFVSILYYTGFQTTVCLNRTVSSVFLSNFNGYSEVRGSPVSATLNIFAVIALMSLAALAIGKIIDDKHVNFVFTFMIATQIIYDFVISYGTLSSTCVIGGVSLFDTNSYAIVITLVVFYIGSTAYNTFNRKPPKASLPVSFSTTAIAAYLLIYFLVLPSAESQIIFYAIMMVLFAGLYHFSDMFLASKYKSMNSELKSDYHRAPLLLLLFWPAFLVSALATEFYFFFLTRPVHAIELAIFAFFLALYFVLHLTSKRPIEAKPTPAQASAATA